MSKADVLRIPDYLEHIVEAIERIHRYVDDMSEVAFLDDDKTRDAVIRNYEILGEAARNVGALPRGICGAAPASSLGSHGGHAQ